MSISKAYIVALLLVLTMEKPLVLLGFGVLFLSVVYIPVPPMVNQKLLSRFQEKLGMGSYGKLFQQNAAASTRYFSSLLEKENVSSLQISDESFNGVPVRIYRPEGAQDDHLNPAFVYYHGGGWVVGSIESMDRALIHIAKQLKNVIVISVEYRLAPDHLFPTAVDDCFAATDYVLDNSKSLGIDATRVAVGGDSAGGTLAVDVSMKMAEAGKTLAAQVLIYPVLQAADFAGPSYTLRGDDYFLTKNLMLSFWSIYLSGDERYFKTFDRNTQLSSDNKRKIGHLYIKEEELPEALKIGYKTRSKQSAELEVDDLELQKLVLNPLVSPLLAEDLSRQPPTFLYTCEHDVLRDEGFHFKRRLQESGVRVEHYHEPSGFHGIFPAAPALKDAAVGQSKMVQFLHRTFQLGKL